MKDSNINTVVFIYLKRCSPLIYNSKCEEIKGDTRSREKKILTLIKIIHNKYPIELLFNSILHYFEINKYIIDVVIKFIKITTLLKIFVINNL